MTSSWHLCHDSMQLYCIIWKLSSYIVEASECIYPDCKIHGPSMGPTWVLSAPDGPHVGPMNLAIRVYMSANWVSIGKMHLKTVSVAFRPFFLGPISWSASLSLGHGFILPPVLVKVAFNSALLFREFTLFVFPFYSRNYHNIDEHNFIHKQLAGGYMTQRAGGPRADLTHCPKWRNKDASDCRQYRFRQSFVAWLH